MQERIGGENEPGGERDAPATDRVRCGLFTDLNTRLSLVMSVIAPRAAGEPLLMMAPYIPRRDLDAYSIASGSIWGPPVCPQRSPRSSRDRRVSRSGRHRW